MASKGPQISLRTALQIWEALVRQEAFAGTLPPDEAHKLRGKYVRVTARLMGAVKGVRIDKEVVAEVLEGG